MKDQTFSMQVKFKKKKIKLNSNNSKLYCPFTVSPSALLPLGISSVISINSRLNEHQRIRGMRGTCDSFLVLMKLKTALPWANLIRIVNAPTTPPFEKS